MCSVAADAVLTLDNHALRMAQNKDFYCHYVLQSLQKMGPHRYKMGPLNSKILEERNMQPFHVLGGILHRFVTRANGKTSSALVVPVSMQYKLLRAAHAHH